MKARPTRAERRFDDILDEALKGFNLPINKATQIKKTKWDRKKRKFKKQRIFSFPKHKKSYIVDFYIPALRLAIEVDGPSHNSQKKYDSKRTELLATKGIKVLRFKNEETCDFHECKNKVVPLIESRIKELRLKGDKRAKQTQRRGIKREYGYYLKMMDSEQDKQQFKNDSDQLIKEFLENGGEIKKLP